MRRTVILTPRELKVLDGLKEGGTCPSIARGWGISEHTIHRHKESIFTKLDAKNAANAVYLAVKRGLIE